MFLDHAGMKFEMSNKQIWDIPKKQKLNNTILNNQWVKEEITQEISKYVEINKSENKTHKNLWDTTK